MIGKRICFFLKSLIGIYFLSKLTYFLFIKTHEWVLVLTKSNNNNSSSDSFVDSF